MERLVKTKEIEIREFKKMKEEGEDAIKEFEKLKAEKSGWIKRENELVELVRVTKKDVGKVDEDWKEKEKKY